MTRDEDPVSPPGSGKPKTKAYLARSEDFDNTKPNFKPPTLSIFLYRVEINRVTRPGWSGVGNLDGQGHLPLDLRFLITAWGDNAEDEYRLLGKAMQTLEATPILTGPLLYEPAPLPAPPTFNPNEGVQVVHDDLSTADIFQIFDSLQSDYKLSVPYLARVVRIDTKVLPVPAPVANVIRGVVPSSTP
jgi:hypothetical protein